MEKRHNSDAYAIVIASRYLAEKALDVYHGASRGEVIKYDLARLQEELQSVCKALDTFNANKESI